MEPYIETRPATQRTRKVDGAVASEEKLTFTRGMGFTVVVCGAYVLWTALGFGSSRINQVLSDCLIPLISTISVIWSLWGSRKDPAGRACPAANFMTLGIFGYGLGAYLWIYYELIAHQTAFPSWADAAYLPGSLLMLVGVLLVPIRPLAALARVRLLLDSLLIMAGFMTFSWFFALGPTILQGTGSLLAKILGSAYPLMDLAMMFCILGVSAKSPEPGFRQIRNLVCVSILGYVASDIVFGYLNLRNQYLAGNPFDGGWMVSNLCLAQAAYLLRKRRSTLSQHERVPCTVAPPAFWRNLLPYALVPAIGLLAVYVYERKLTSGLATGVYIGAAILVALLLVRQLFAIAENRRLYRSLHDAYQELEALAKTDGMTGLPNHRIFQERLRTEIEQAKGSGEEVTLLLIDVDRFKSYNDHFGHPAGDEALRIVAGLLRESVRGTDLAARYGGEEFAAILPTTEVEAARVVAERIRTACEGSVFPCRKVTLSIGLATWREGDASALIERADRALYLAKQGGRNRVVVDRRSYGASADATVFPEGWSIHTTRVTGMERLAELVTEMENGPAGPVLTALLAVLNLRDEEVEQHSDRVMRYCLRLAEQLVRRGEIHVSTEELCDLHLGALLHDIGKVGVPDAILHKPGALSEEEWSTIRRHPVQGANLLANIPLLAAAVPVVRSHHERWDGTGYPDGLAGESIPLGARIFALADTLDAMWSDRPYRSAQEYTAIREEVALMAGSQFDPRLVEAFLSIPQSEWERIRSGEAPVEVPPTLRIAA